MDSILENISFADCCAISMSKRWNLTFFMTHVRKVMSFDYSNFSRYTFSMLLLWSREEIYQIITVKYWIRIKVCAANLLLLWMCVLHFYAMNISNKFFKTISCNENYYMRFYSTTQLLMYNNIIIWGYNICYILCLTCVTIIHKETTKSQDNFAWNNSHYIYHKYI